MGEVEPGELGAEEHDVDRAQVGRLGPGALARPVGGQVQARFGLDAAAAGVDGDLPQRVGDALEPLAEEPGLARTELFVY
ncbi:MAG TPA: hypothetical protein VFU12_09910 [Glycomyces sp.]|nr:hypothetical protein [Glycomyces sp.]